MEEKKEAKSYMKFMRSTSHEYMYRVFMESLSSYFKSLTTFGFKNPYTKECYKVVKEMYLIMKEEKRLLTMLDNNFDWINPKAFAKMLEILQELSVEEYMIYSDDLDEVEKACEDKNDKRLVRPYKEIDSLITNDEYKNKVYDLIQKGTM